MSLTQKRTQLYLPLALYRAVMEAARDQGESLASVVRAALGFYLAQQKKKRPMHRKNDPLNRLVGVIKDGPGDLASSVDEELYR